MLTTWTAGKTSMIIIIIEAMLRKPIDAKALSPMR